MPRIGAYLADELGIKNVAVVWANTEFGKGGHDAFIEVAGSEGIEIVAGIPTEQAQVDFAADVTKLKSSSAERSSSI
jgi:branched-chain amino acid transport system substrate-binding protein